MSAETSADASLGTVLDGRYRLVSKLGQGAMGSVYRAERLEDGTSVAVKLLAESFGGNVALRKRFDREVRALFGLSHPNILAVHDYGVHDERPFLVMELLEGTTLDRYVETTDPDLRTSLDLAAQVLEGLAHAHASGVLHRDLKTENVFVVTERRGHLVAKLLDFGLAKFTSEERWGPEGTALTVQGSVLGTPAYMSPEQATGAPLDARSDVYSTGVILFELLTGTWPFVEEDTAAMLRAHLAAPPPTLTETRPSIAYPPELETVVQVALAKKPEDRYRDAASMLSAVRAIRIRDSKVHAPPQLPSHRKAVRATDTRWLIVAVAGLIAAAAGALAWATLR